MAVKTFEDYFNRLKDMRPNVYINGEKVDRTDERLRAGINVIKETYDCTNNPEFEDICVTTSHLTGEKNKQVLSYPSKCR